MMVTAEAALPLLEQSIPDYKTELNYRNPFELLIATILSAQCTDERVNRVTAVLFFKYPDGASLAAASTETIEEEIRSTGFYRDKTKRILGCSRALVEDFKGQVPQTLEELVRLPGVGRKTANLMLGEAFKQPAVVVDTHVRRVANRLSLTSSQDADEIELDLQKWLPRKDWWPGSSRLLLHGRYVCLAKKPRCPECLLRGLCPSAGLGGG
jgi:endonuclease-3